MNIAHLLVSQAAAHPDAAAIIETAGHRIRQISFAELENRSSACGAFLASSNVSVGDSVLVFVPMSIDLYVALIAIFRIGAVATFLDPSSGAKHIARCCEMLKPAAMIALSKAHLLRLTSAAIRKIPKKFSLGWPVPGAMRWERGSDYSTRSSILRRDDNDPALLTFTSGSTGIPKAAVRSHGFLAAQHASLARAIELAPGEIDLATLPIFSLANLASGVTTVIPNADLRRPGEIDPRPVLKQIAEMKVTRCVASPAFFERLLTRSEAAEAMKSLQQVFTGGAPVFPKLMDQLQLTLPHARVVAVYGSTEAEPIAHIARHEISDADSRAMFGGAGLLAGEIVSDIDLRVIRNQWGTSIAPMTGEQFSASVLPPKVPGEIVVHGAHVLRGYLNGQGDEQTKFRVDEQVWHRTGDAGYLDADGRLWLLGRAEAKIDSDSGLIYPFAVECAASRIEGVARSALIRHGGRNLLIVQPIARPPPALEESLRRALSWARIDGIRLMGKIPLDKRHNAKIDYPALRQMLRLPLPSTRGRGAG